MSLPTLRSFYDCIFCLLFPHTTLKNGAYLVCSFPAALFLKRGGLAGLHGESTLISLCHHQVFLIGEQGCKPADTSVIRVQSASALASLSQKYSV